MSINQVIQRRRRALGMTQEQVAQALLGALLRNLEADPAYDFLRGEPEFRALIAERREQIKL